MFPNQFRSSKNGKPEKGHDDICNLMGGKVSVEEPMKRKTVGGFMHIIIVSLYLVLNIFALWRQ